MKSTKLPHLAFIFLASTCALVWSVFYSKAGNSILTANLLNPAVPQAPGDILAPVSPASFSTQILQFPVYTGDGGLIGDSNWKAIGSGSSTTGNCCENYISVTPDGWIADIGGGSIYLSKDRGESWERILPINSVAGGTSPVGDLIIPEGGEGAISYAPGGDIIGITWNEKIDRLLTFKYNAADQKWYTAVAELSTPFSDRPWISVLEGPFFPVGGGSVPYISIIKAGFPSKDVIYLSTDGLHYIQPSYPDLDQATNDPVHTTLELPTDPDADWMQPNVSALIYPLTGGSGLAFYGNIASIVNPLTVPVEQPLKDAKLGIRFAKDTIHGYSPVYLGENHSGSAEGSAAAETSACEWNLLNTNASWACLNITLGSLPGGIFQTDSRGYLHRASYSHSAATKLTTLVYELSKDGGRNWQTLNYDLPLEWTLEGFDLKVNGALDMVAMLIRAEKPDGRSHFLLYKIQNVAANPATTVTYMGLGDQAFGSSVLGALGARYDFPTLAILPDGKIVTSFGDSAHTRPTMVIEQ